MEQLKLFPGDSPVSHSLSPGKDLEVKITVTSGRRCCGLLTRSGLLGSLAKTLLVSSAWYSPVCRLTWQSKPIFQKKIRRSSRSMSSSSKQYVRILSESDIPSNRFLFQLAVQVRHTAETGCGLSPTSKEPYSGLNPAPSNPSQSVQPDLIQLAKVGLLPTPTASDNRDRGGPQTGAIQRRIRLGKQVGLTMLVHGHLNPLFVAEMMGFPDHWLTSLVLCVSLSLLSGVLFHD